LYTIIYIYTHIIHIIYIYTRMYVYNGIYRILPSPSAGLKLGHGKTKLGQLFWKRMKQTQQFLKSITIWMNMWVCRSWMVCFWDSKPRKTLFVDRQKELSHDDSWPLSTTGYWSDGQCRSFRYIIIYTDIEWYRCVWLVGTIESSCCDIKPLVTKGLTLPSGIQWV
jgi:hypothetical protein